MNRLGFGLMRLPRLENGEIDIKLFTEMVDAYLAAGGSYFDTAYGYHGGKSEVAFREAVVKRYPRDRFTVTDKLPVFAIETKERVPEIFAEQLTRCGVSYFDYYWLHSLRDENYHKAEELGMFSFVRQKREEGVVRHLGFSFHGTPKMLERILTEHPEMEYVQLQLNYLDWDDPAVRAGECYEIATRHGKTVIVMEPVKGGALANIPNEAEAVLKARDLNASAASWAIRYALSLDRVMVVLSGMSNMEQMEDNLSSMAHFKPLTAEEREVIGQAAEAIRSSIAIPCTACRYCVEGCPQRIAIPDYFAIYNEFRRFNSTGLWAAQMGCRQLAEKNGKASDCIGCGKCEAVCPQGIAIRTGLQEVAAALEN